MDAAAYAGLSKALCVAVKSKITDNLSTTKKNISTIAKECKISVKGAKLVLDCLEAFGYVTKKGDLYAFSDRGYKYLDSNSPDCMKYFILFSNTLYDSYIKLAETVKNGRSSLNIFEDYGEKEWELYSRAMIEISRTNIPEVVSKIKISKTAKELLDLGGMHGQYSIALCKKKSDLKATILDYEAVRKYAAECISKHKMDKRIKFKASNIMKEEIPKNVDIALLFNVIHGFDSDINEALFKKIAHSLNKGGQLIVLDQIKDAGSKSQMSRATTAYMALNLLHQSNGDTYSYTEIKKWAENSGFSSTAFKSLHSPGFALIICSK